MALMHVGFFSEVLGLSCNMDVIVPEQTHGQIGQQNNIAEGERKVLYLLHGLSDDHTIWQRRTSIERYAAEYGVTVVMPTVFRGFYTDTKYGAKYWTFVSEELPRIVNSFFRVSQKREDTFAAGLSMGGYGALKLGLLCPDKFAGVASLSGAADMEKLFTREDPALSKEMEYIFGSYEELKGSDNDLVAVAERHIEKGTDLPQIYMVCGTEDFLYQNNIAFRDRFAGRLPLTYKEGPGVHDWAFWDCWIQDVLKWMFNKEG